VIQSSPSIRLQIRAEARLGEHPPVADQYHMRDPDEPRAELLDLDREGLGIPHGAGEDLHGDRAARAIGQEPEDEVPRVPPPLAAVTVPRQGTLATLERGRGHVADDETAVGQMLVGHGLLDPRWLRE